MASSSDPFIQALIDKRDDLVDQLTNAVDYSIDGQSVSRSQLVEKIQALTELISSGTPFEIEQIIR